MNQRQVAIARRVPSATTRAERARPSTRNCAVDELAGMGTADPTARGSGPEPTPVPDLAPATAPSRWQWAVDAAVLFGLAGVAITQPLLELLGSNPTFFVAGHYETGQIVSFGVLVAFVPAVVVFTLTALPGLASRRLAPVLHGAGVATLAALIALVLARTWGVDSVVLVAAAAVLGGVGVAVAERRSKLVRQFLAYLALGNVAFLALFLTASPTAELLGAGDVASQQGQVNLPPLAGPVVVIVLDEFPVTAIMRGDGTINDARYPHLARLAERSTWFRNAASESRTTYVSTPTILTGVRASDNDLPILEEHPRNYFSLFGDGHPVNRYELVTDMCPAAVCEPPPAQPMSRLLDDASIVYRHRVLPSDLRDGLPPVDTAWGSFGNVMDDAVDDDGEVGGDARGSVAPTYATTTTEVRRPMDQAEDIPDDEITTIGQAEVFRRQVELIGSEPSVNFTHVLLPHHPYRLTPWGDGLQPATRLPDEIATGGNRLPAVGDPAYGFRFRQVYVMQAMQVGAVDVLLGEMIDHLEAVGAWDDALVVVTSDHGIDMSAPGFTRREDASNTDELFRVPLFVKAPGQTEAVVDDAPASTVDILPSIIDLLDIETDWEMEGHSLFDGSEPSIDRHVQSGVEAPMLLAAAHEAQFVRGDDWVALAAVGEGEDLVGTPVAGHSTGAASGLTWTLDHGEVLDDLSLAHDQVPYVMEGTVSGSVGRPPELVVAVNGTLAGTLGGYLADGDSWSFTGFVAPFFEDGRNEVVAYEVERTGGTVTLHPLVT